MKGSASLKGKVVLITGGTGGIGKACSALFAKAGAYVISAAVDAPQREQGVGLAPGQVTETWLDVTKESSVTALFREIDSSFDALDIVINAAGTGVFKECIDLSIDEWKRTLDTNLTGVFLCMREAVRIMAKKGGGRIINLGSIAGEHGLRGNGAYGASKAGVGILTEIINEEYKQHGVRATLAILGAVDTPLSRGQLGFESRQMLRANDVARLLLEVARLPLTVRVDKLAILPPSGVL